MKEIKDPFLDFIDFNLRKLKKKIKIDIPYENINEEELEKKLELFNKLISDSKNLPISFIVSSSKKDNQDYLMEIALEEKILKIHKKFRRFCNKYIDNKNKENINNLINKIKEETNWEKSIKRKFYTQIDKIEIKDNENKMDDITYFVDYIQNRVLNREHPFKSLTNFLPEWSLDNELDNIKKEEVNISEDKLIKKNKSLIDIYDIRKFKENKSDINKFMKKYINSLDFKVEESKNHLFKRRD